MSTHIRPELSTALALHDISIELDAATIVVGSSRRVPIGRVLAGNIGAALLHGAPCPVVIAPRGYEARPEGFQRIGVHPPHPRERRRAARPNCAGLHRHACGMLRLSAGAPTHMLYPCPANGGPVLAWGVEGYVVSFIAPHTLTARALVVAPGDTLAVTNRSREEDVEMTTDGRAVCVLPREDTITIRFELRCAQLAQLPGASFYHRLRDKFGRLAY